MAVARVGLLVADSFCAEALKQVLSDADFDVESPNIDIRAIQDASVLDPYDLVIINNDVAQSMEEGVFSLILSARGFLLVDSARSIDDFSLSSTRYINPYMSPEDIISRVNSVLFQHRDIRKSPRIGVNFDVEYFAEGKCFRSNLQTLSLNGGFIATLNHPAAHTFISMKFSLPGSSTEIKTGGTVLYSIGYDLDRGIIAHPGSSDRRITAMPGMGILFEGLSDEDRQAIRIYIEERVF